jgi:hypothetical protein
MRRYRCRVFQGIGPATADTLAANGAHKYSLVINLKTANALRLTEHDKYSE